MEDAVVPVMEGEGDGGAGFAVKNNRGIYAGIDYPDCMRLS